MERISDARVESCPEITSVLCFNCMHRSSILSIRLEDRASSFLMERNRSSTTEEGVSVACVVGVRSEELVMVLVVPMEDEELQLVHKKLSLVFSETVHNRRHAPIEIARTHLVRVS
jgi:hypothetical protein